MKECMKRLLTDKKCYLSITVLPEDVKENLKISEAFQKDQLVIDSCDDEGDKGYDTFVLFSLC